MTEEQIKQVREEVKLIDVLASIGKKVNRNGFCKCPLHNGDNTASFKVYPNNTFYCFGCHKIGDVIKFTEEYYQVDFKTAYTMLGGKEDNSWASRRKSEQERLEREQRKAFDEYLNEQISKYERQLHALDRQLRALSFSEEYITNEMVDIENERMKVLRMLSSFQQYRKGVSYAT